VNNEQDFMTNRFSQLLILGVACWPVVVSAGEHEQHANEIAGFFGLTHESNENGPAFGLEYERRISDTLGLGVLAEKTSGDINSWVYAVPFTIHAEEWKFTAALGIEEKHGHTENLIRIGVGHEFEMSELKITPSLSVDFVDSETIYILGVSFGIGF